MATETWQIDELVTAPFESPLLAFYNAETSDGRREFEIEHLQIQPIPMPVTAGFGAYNVSRVTSVTGGTTVVATKHNDGATSLPSQVQAVILPDAVTGASDFSRVALQLLSPDGPGFQGFDSYSNSVGAKSASIFEVGRDTTLQGYILAEGQGIAIRPQQHPGSVAWIGHCLIVVGAASYSYEFELLPPEGHEAVFVIMNNTGSGVSVDVREINFTYAGPNELTPVGFNHRFFRFCFFDNMQDGGVAITPTAHNAGNSAISALQIKKSTFLSRIPVTITDGLELMADFMFNSGLYQKMGTLSRQDQYGWVADSNSSSIQGRALGLQKRQPPLGLTFVGGNLEPVRIRPGEGFAIIPGYQSAFSVYRITATINHITPPAGGGSSEHAFTWVM